MSISGYISLAISDSLCLSMTIPGFPCQVSSIRGQVEAGEGNKLISKTFWLILLFFSLLSRIIYREARAPKKKQNKKLREKLRIRHKKEEEDLKITLNA